MVCDCIAVLAISVAVLVAALKGGVLPSHWKDKG